MLKYLLRAKNLLVVMNYKTTIIVRQTNLKGHDNLAVDDTVNDVLVKQCHSTTPIHWAHPVFVDQGQRSEQITADTVEQS